MSLSINNPESELSADNFASEQLIPHEEYILFIGRKKFSKEGILNFADKINISPALIVGRLQHDGYLPWNAYSEMKVQYHIV